MRVILLLLFAALVAALIFAPRYEYETVLDLPTQAEAAADGAFVGVGDPGDEVELECPVGIEPLNSGAMAIVDAATRRILTVDLAEARVASAARLALDPRLFPTAAAFEDGKLWLWGQSASGDLQAPFGLARDGDAVFPQFQSGQTEDSRALSRFRDLGLTRRMPFSQATPGGPSNDRADEDAASSLAVETYERSDAYDWSEIVPGENGRGATARFSINGAKVGLAARAADGAERAIDVAAPRTVLTAHALGAGPAGEVYFAVQNWDPNASEFDIREEVRRTDLPGTVYDVPLAESDCVPKQHVATTPEGEVYFLRVGTERVALLKLKPRGIVNQARAWLEGRGVALPRLRWQDVIDAVGIGGAKAQTLQSGGVIARRDVVANACAYLRETWTPTASNLAAPAGTCACKTGTCDRQFTPATDLVVAAGQSVTGLPYNWGGADDLAAFRRKVAAGRPGGNVCTNGGKGILRDAADPTGLLPAGVDCSGFVTRALGYAGTGHPYTTSNLATIADPVAKLDMKPGDIANKAGSHVRMLLNWRRPASGAPWDSVELIESTTAWDGVGRKIYSLAELSGGGSKGGYKMLRPKRIADSGGPIGVDLLTCGGS